ncbi:MAG: single-stranded DNA-binding protein [Acidimicrobiia bacterium]
MDLNLTVLCGRLATDAELRIFDSGTRLIRYLVMTRADHPRRRVDVIAVTLWDPPDDLADEPGEKGQRIWVCGSVQKRFWESPDGRQSRLEVVAEQVNFKEVDELEPVAAE